MFCFSDSGEVLTQMSAGDFFGEIGILNLDGGVNRCAVQDIHDCIAGTVYNESALHSQTSTYVLHIDIYTHIPYIIILCIKRTSIIDVPGKQIR